MRNYGGQGRLLGSGLHSTTTLEDSDCTLRSSKQQGHINEG